MFGCVCRGAEARGEVADTDRGEQRGDPNERHRARSYLHAPRADRRADRVWRRYRIHQRIGASELAEPVHVGRSDQGLVVGVSLPPRRAVEVDERRVKVADLHGVDDGGVAIHPVPQTVADREERVRREVGQVELPVVQRQRHGVVPERRGAVDEFGRPVRNRVFGVAGRMRMEFDLQHGGLRSRRGSRLQPGRSALLPIAD